MSDAELFMSAIAIVALALSVASLLSISDNHRRAKREFTEIRDAMDKIDRNVERRIEEADNAEVEYTRALEKYLGIKGYRHREQAINEIRFSKVSKNK